MPDGTRDYQQMAVAILAIATAALGFGLWNQDFALPETGDPRILLLHYVQRGLGVLATILYFAAFITVGRILWQKERVTGQDLVTRPMVWLYLQMFALALLFLVGNIADITAAVPDAPAGERPAMPNDPLPSD